MRQRKVQVLGIDAGGTMTDTFFVDDEGTFVVGKAQSTPQDESLGLVNSCGDALEGWGLDNQSVFSQLITGVYSGTAMLNRVVQRKGQKVGLIVNRGMEDIHRMGRAVQSYLGYSYEDRIHLNTHRYDDPLVPLAWTRGVTERTDMFGNVVIPLNEAEAERAARELIGLGVEAIVVCLLHSYKNPVHELKLKEIAEAVASSQNGGVPVFASVEYYPVRKETHRLNTTILEAYAAEPSRKTLARIAERFRELGAKFDLRVMASHGGTISWNTKELARTLVSGPIGGVIGARYLGDELGMKNLACTDIGGTSFDMALITQGEFTIQLDPDMARLELSLPLLAMDSVGAGAGTFVRLDPYTNAIKLGPDSAGYRVGVCWEEGGIDTASVSDCHVVLGYINPDNFLGGKLKLNKKRAQDAVEEQIARPLGLSVEQAAKGVIELLELQLKDHLKSMISAKGYHPASFVLFSYGGAGPVHTYGYTQGLGFEDVVVPAWAAGFSAFGCAAAEFEYRYDKSLDVNVLHGALALAKQEAALAIERAWEELRQKVYEEFRINAYEPGQVRLIPGFRMQYRGQLNDLEIDSPIMETRTPGDWDRLTEAFEDTYARVYAKAAKSPELGFSVTTAIMRGRVQTIKPRIPKEPVRDPKDALEGAAFGSRPVYFKNGWVESATFTMERMKAGAVIMGPAIIESDATTFVVPPGYRTHLDQHRLFHLEFIQQ